MQRKAEVNALMTKDEIQFIYQSQHLKKERVISDVCDIFQILNGFNILTADLREKVIKHTLTENYNLYSSILEGLKLLKYYQCLDAENAVSFIQYKPLGGFHMVYNLIELNKIQLSTEKHRELCLTITDPKSYIPRILKSLSQINLLNEKVYQYLKDDIDIVVNYHDYFKDFQKTITTEKNPSADFVKQTLKNIRIDMICSELKKMNLYTQKNILRSQKNLLLLKELYYLMFKLNQAKLGNQKNFDIIIDSIEYSHLFFKINFYGLGVFINVANREVWITQKIINQIDIKISALACAQFQHAITQNHPPSRIPDDVVKHIYSFVAPVADDKKARKHFMNNLFKLPSHWQSLPSHVNKNESKLNVTILAKP